MKQNETYHHKHQHKQNLDPLKSPYLDWLRPYHQTIDEKINNPPLFQIHVVLRHHLIE